MSSLAKIERDWLAAPEAAPRAVSLCCVQSLSARAKAIGIRLWVMFVVIV